MNKIVRRHYPAAKLPDDLKDEIGAGKKVTLTIEVEEELESATQSPDWFSRFEHLRRSTFHSLEEVNAHVRTLRDEWSHRDR